jgi:hypothetical protein
MKLDIVADRSIKGRAYPAFAEWQGRPFHPSWRQFDQHWPWTVPLRLEEYCRSWGVDVNLYTADVSVPTTAFYAVGLGFFSFDVDYLSLLSPLVQSRVRAGDFRLLFYYHEGDNPYRIKQRLDQLCELHSFDPDCYVFVSGNTAASKLKNFVWFSDFELWYWHRNRIVKQVDPHPLTRAYDFTALVRGHRSWRMAAMADLWRRGLLDHSQWSYGESGEFSDQDCPIQVDSISDLRGSMSDFAALMPHTCDQLSTDQHNDHSLGVDHLYTDSYVNVVLETHFDVDQSGGAFLTEKTFKPIKNSQPFVVAGGPGSLQALRDLGYRVFDSVLDNSYDLIQDNTQRWQALVECLQHILETGAHRIYQACLPDIQHNQDLFQSLKQQRLNSFIEALHAK